MTIVALRPLDPAEYVSHELHRCERAWPESNCYIDVWLEIIHAIGMEPLACAPFTLATDFEGDQWTFFKPPLAELTHLYGIEIEELTVWRPLIHHVTEHLGQNKLILTEVDAFFLPDTGGTDYRRNHTKTTIAIQSIDVEGRKLGYFHNQGYYRLEGDDFADIFKLDRERDPEILPLYAEFVRLDRARTLPPEDLLALSLELLAFHLSRRPKVNPVTRFGKKFATDLEWLKDAGLATYHAYAFATLRQQGSAFELAGAYLRWLGRQGAGDLEASASRCDVISSTAKALILKGARAVNAKRAADFSPMFAEMETAWTQLMEDLVPRFVRS